MNIPCEIGDGPVARSVLGGGAGGQAGGDSGTAPSLSRLGEISRKLAGESPDQQLRTLAQALVTVCGATLGMVRTGEAGLPGTVVWSSPHRAAESAKAGSRANPIPWLDQIPETVVVQSRERLIAAGAAPFRDTGCEWVATPVFLDGQRVGALAGESDRPGTFGPVTKVVIEMLSDLAATALRELRRIDEPTRARPQAGPLERLKTRLLATTGPLLREQSRIGLLRSICEGLVAEDGVLGAWAGWSARWGGQLRGVAGFLPGAGAGAQFRVEPGLTDPMARVLADAARSGGVRVCRTVGPEAGTGGRAMSVIAIGLRFGGRVRGVLALAATADPAFGGEDGRALLARWGGDVSRALEVLEQTLRARRLPTMPLPLWPGEKLVNDSWERDCATGSIRFGAECGRMLGFARGRSDGSWSEFLAAVHPHDREVVRTGLAPETLHHVPSVGAFRVVRPDGSLGWLSWKTGKNVAGNGPSPRVEATLRDITAQRTAATTRAVDAEAKLKDRWLDLAQEAIVVCDTGFRVTYWNRGAELCLGRSAAETVGRLLGEVLFGAAGIPAATLDALREKGEWRGELELPKTSGSPVVMMSRWTSVRESNGEPAGILILNTDLTEQKKLEAKLLRASRLESIGTLASGVAHDLNNVLAPILMAAPLLRSPMSAEQLESFVSLIETNAQRGADIVKQLVMFGRGVQGERITLQLRHLFKDLLRMVKETFPRNVQVETRLPAELWPVCGDLTQLYQVFLNLGVNARDAMPRGGTIRFSATNLWLDEARAAANPGAHPGPYVALSVADTGLGMTREVMDRIFEPFYTTKEYGQGTGLGLPTTMGIVKSHGGFITVESSLGKGSQFVVHLPALPNAPAPVEKPESGSRLHGHGQLILVVDDEPGVRKVLRAALEGHGYQVVTAVDGADGLASFVKRRTDIALVVADIMMPVMDGEVFVRTIRRLNPQSRVVVCTGDMASPVQRQRLQRLQELRVDRIVPKPFTAEEILQVLHEVLNSK
ncbi:MAG: ATP-binding protein [Limisphaerales bacterium]